MKSFGHPRQPHRRLGIPSEQHGDHVVDPELLGHLVDAAHGDLGAEVAFRGFLQLAQAVDEPFVRRRMHVHVDGLERHGVGSGHVDVGDAAAVAPVRPVATVAGFGERVGRETDVGLGLHQLRR